VVGSARVMSYEDIVEAQKQPDLKEAAAKVTLGRRSKWNVSTRGSRKEITWSRIRRGGT
jgi:hypothetical protein